MGHHYVRTEHVLLGLLRERDGTAAQVLNRFDSNEQSVRREIVRMLTATGFRPDVLGNGGTR